MSTIDLNFNWINLLILFGALQGLIFGIILSFNKKHPGAKFLAVFMFTLAYNGFETFNWSSSLGKYIFFFDLFPFVMIYAIGPSIYLYVRSLVRPQGRPSFGEVLAWYVPVVFQFLSRLVIITIFLLTTYQIISTDALLEQLDKLYYTYSEPLSVVTFLFYLYLTIRVYRQSRTFPNSPARSNETTQEVYKWTRLLLFSMVILAMAWPITLLAPLVLNFRYDSYYYPLELGLVIFIYWIAFVGYLRTRVILIKEPKSLVEPIPGEEVEKMSELLRQAMEGDKLYLDPGLNRQKLAAHTGIHAKMISAILNQHLHQNFNDFINAYRVREACEKLLSPAHQHLTISGIAFESGFNSQATFQRAFKSYTGMSPREYVTRQTVKQ